MMNGKGQIKSNRADHLEKTALPPPNVVIRGDMKVVTDYRWNKYGKKEKVIRTFKIEKQLVSKTVAGRKTWAKFGDSRNDAPGPNSSTMIPAEEVQMQFLPVNQKAEEDPSDTLKNLTIKVKCRTCGGKHWTHSCHLKGTGLMIKDKQLVQEKNTSTNRPYAAPPAREGAINTGGLRDPYAWDNGYAPSIHIFNLSASTSIEDFSELVSAFGPVARMKLMTNRQTGACKGYAFVTYKFKVDAERAIKELNGYAYDHLILNVDWQPAPRVRVLTS